MSATSPHQLHEDDEEGFILYEEYIIFEIQKNLRSKEGLEHKPLLELCAKLEDLLYQNTLKDYSVATTTNLWGKKDYLNHYQNISAKFLLNLQSKQLNWKKLFDEHEKNPDHVYQQIFKDDHKKASKATKPKQVSEGGEAAPPKTPKVPKIKEEKKTAPKAPKATTSKKKFIPAPTLTAEESQAQVQELFQETLTGHATVDAKMIIPPSDDLHDFNLLINEQPDSSMQFEDFDLGFDMSEGTIDMSSAVKNVSWK